MPLRPDMEPADFLDILRRRKWMILFTVLLVLFGATLYCVMASELYQSTVKIRIIPPAVPEGMVRSTVNMETKDRLSFIRQEVLSRASLHAVIEEMNLFEEDRKKLSGDDIVSLMRDRITMGMTSATTFFLSVDHENPQVAKDVVSRLGLLFIEQNSKSREAATQGTTQFFDSQLEETRKKLVDQEDKLKSYKIQYSGELPEQMNANLSQLTRLQEQIKNNTDAIMRMEDRKAFLESQISAAENNPDGGFSAYDPLDPAAHLLPELASRRKKLYELSSKYTLLHPAVVQAQTQLTQLETRITSLRQAASAVSDGSKAHPSTNPSATNLQSGAIEGKGGRRLREQIATIDLEIASRKRGIANATKTIDAIQSKVERLPQREQELISLTRDYGNLKLSYEDLLKKKLQSGVSESLEEKQQGEQFQLIDPANLPTKPIKPDRLKILLLALMASIVAGAGGAVAFEVLNPKLRAAKDFRGFFDLPILGCLPAIENAEYRRRIAVRRAAVIGGLVSISGAWLVLLVVHGAKIRSIFLSIGEKIGGGN